VLDALGAARSAPVVVPLSAPAASALSVPPVARTPAPTKAPKRRGGGGLLSTLVLLLGLTAVAAVLTPKSLLELATRRVPAVQKLIDLRTKYGIPDWIGAKLKGSLLVTAKGPNNAPVKGVRVFLDGALRCEEVPCRVEDLKNGSHVVRVSAEGHEATADRAIIVDGETAFDVSLIPTKSEEPPPPPVVLAKPPATGTSEPPAAPAAPTAMIDADDPALAAGASAPSSNRAMAAAARPKQAAAAPALARRLAGEAAAPAAKEKPAAAAAAAEEPAAADDKGIMRLSSTPSSNVVVDGRPIGMTPKTVRVKAGSHTVVFASGTDRNVQSVNVKPGATISVGAKF